MTQNNQDGVGDFLKIIRMRNRKSVKEVSNSLGVQLTEVINWENDRSGISAGKLDELASVYEMTEDEKYKFLKLLNQSGINLDVFSASPELLLESQILCAWMALSKEAREKTLRMMKAYETSLKENE